MKILFVTCLLAFATIEPTSAFFQWIQCGLQTGRSLHRCVKDCKEQNPCSHAMEKCKLGDQFLRLACRAVASCACKDCLLCVIKCVVSDLYDRADCNYAEFIHKVLKKLGVKSDIPQTKEGAIEGLGMILGDITQVDLKHNENVTIKPESETEEDDDDEESEFDDDENDEVADDDEDNNDDINVEDSISDTTEEPSDIVA